MRAIFFFLIIMMVSYGFKVTVFDYKVKGRSISF